MTDGERWTRVELARLRDGGWRPRVWLEFLWAAQIQANRTRRRRPALARQAGEWMLAGAAAWLIVARLLPASPFARRRRQGLIWWGVCALMLDWHLGMLESPDGRAARLGAADALTLARAWLVPAVAERGDPAMLLLGALTDVADGPVARVTRTTRFGRDLEGVIDGCFAAAALQGAVRGGGVSRLHANVERARLVAGTGFTCTVYFAAGRAPDPAVRLSGRRTGAVRVAGLMAGGLGHRTLANQLLLMSSAAALAELLRHPERRRAVAAAGRR